MIKLQIKRGSKEKLPEFDVAEYGFTTDTEELYIGGPKGNRQIPLLGTDGKLPDEYIPDSVAADLGEVTESVAGMKGDVEALNAFMNDAKKWWDYLAWKYDCETVIEDGDGSSYAKRYTSTLKDGDSVIATCVTTKAMTGTQFVSVYTIGDVTRTYTETKDETGKWKGVWS